MDMDIETHAKLSQFLTVLLKGFIQVPLHRTECHSRPPPTSTPAMAATRCSSHLKKVHDGDLPSLFSAKLRKN